MRLPPLRRFYSVFDPLKNPKPVSSLHKVFGELGSRKAAREEASKYAVDVLGVHVPGKPEEPNNCCMSGCVNCVWVLFRDEYLEYKKAKREAIRRLKLPENKDVPWPPQLIDAAEGKDKPQISTGIEAFIDAEKRIYDRRTKRKQNPNSD